MNPELNLTRVIAIFLFTVVGSMAIGCGYYLWVNRNGKQLFRAILSLFVSVGVFLYAVAFSSLTNHVVELKLRMFFLLIGVILIAASIIRTTYVLIRGNK